MSLSAPTDRPGPIFDCIKPVTVVDKFPVRRLPTLAQKSLLSEKHIPLKPSVSQFFRKCYCSNSLRLYKLRKQQTKHSTFIELHKINKNNEQFIQFSDINNIGKIRQTTHEMPLSETSSIINSQTATYSELSPDSRNDLHTYELVHEHGNFRHRNLGFFLMHAPDRLKIKYSDNSGNLSARLSDCYFSPNRRSNIALFARSIFAPHLKLANFGKINDYFSFFSPDNQSFALNFTSQNLPTTQQHRFIQTAKQLLTNFQPDIRNFHASFDFGHEIGRNLIIGSRPDIRASKKIKTLIDVRPHQPTADLKPHDKSESIDHSTPAKFYDKPLQPDLIFLPTVESRPAFMLQKTRLHQLQKAHEQYPTNFKARPSQKNSWLRLKLRLHKYSMENPSPELTEPTTTRAILACTTGSNALNRMPFPRLIKSPERPLKIRQKAITSELTSPQFCLKADKPFLKTRSQALYTRKIMRKLIAVDAFGKSRKQFFIKGWKGFFALADNLDKTLQLSSAELVEIISHIRIRPLQFFMQISAMDFTDIVLPLNRRRLVPPRGLFPTSFSLNSRQGSHIHLRLFRADSVSAQLQLSASALRPVRRIAPAFSQLKHFSLPVPMLPLCSRYFSHAQCTDRKLTIAPTAKLNALNFISTVPDSICDRLKLRFAILTENQAANRLPIAYGAPPAWEKSARTFNCRLRLLPFAFGFPSFGKKHFLLHPMSPTFKPHAKSGDTTRLKSVPSYSSANNRQYYPPLSQKNPRAWLYSFTIARVLKATKFKPASAKQFLEVSTLKPPREFAYTWYVKKSSKLFYQARPLNLEKIRREKISSVEPITSISSYYQRSLENTDNIEYTGIRRFLLKIPAYSSVKLKDKSFGLYDSFVCKLFKPDDLKHRMGFKPPFLSLYRNFLPICRDILAFEHKLKVFEKLKLNKLTRFNAMFRVFRFPYVPEYAKVRANLNENCFSLEDTSTEMNDSFSDDIRATQISGAFEILHKPFSFNQNLTPAYPQLKPDHADSDIRESSNYEGKSTLLICCPIKAASAERKVSIATKYLFFPKLAPGNFTYSSRTAQCTICSFPQPEPKRFDLNFLLRSRRDHQFDKQDAGSIHWVIMLKNFMQISQKALRYVKKDFASVCYHINSFASGLPIKPLDYRSATTSNKFKFFAPEIPDFFAKSLQQHAMTHDLAELEYRIAAGTSHNHDFFHELKVEHQFLSYAHHGDNEVRLNYSHKHIQAEIAAEVTPQTQKIALKNSFTAESAARNEFANVFISPADRPENFRHPGYPEWIDMDIDVLRKKADSNKDKVKFLLIPLRH